MNYVITTMKGERKEMKRKLTVTLLALMMVASLAACGSKNEGTPQATPTPEANIETFAAEYEMKGTTSSGVPKNDTFIFEGTTTDGIITELNFDIIRNKGLDGEYSKKGIMGYMMNVSDAEVKATDSGFELANMGMNGYNNELGQYMITATCPELTEETTFKDITIKNYTGDVLDMEMSLSVYQHLADEAGIELTEETLAKDLLAIHGLYKDGAFVEGTNRVSFAGINGGRSYGEQIDAIVAYILEQKMTLEEVYEMFKTVNQQSTPIEDRDTISGATIAFVGDFQRMVYVAINGELYEGVVTHTVKEGNTVVEIVSQGYAGEVETHVTFDAEGKIIAISIRDANETPEIGGVLTAEDSEFINALIAGQEDVDSVETVSGATSTSNALIKAVKFAIEYYQGL